MSWATADQVSDITGVTVTDAQVTQAQFVIELFAEVTETYKLKARDVRILRMAVAYQAAWLNGQIDVTSRTDVSSATQDEMSWTAAHEETNQLAPLTRQCLKRLSWKGPRSSRVRRPVDTIRQADPEEAFVTDTGGPPYRSLGS